MSNAAQCVKMLVQGMIEDRETYTTLKRDAELSEQLITHLAVVRQLLIKRHQLRVEQVKLCGITRDNE
jgi:hypothetical protein